MLKNLSAAQRPVTVAGLRPASSAASAGRIPVRCIAGTSCVRRFVVIGHQPKYESSRCERASSAEPARALAAQCNYRKTQCRHGQSVGLVERRNPRKFFDLFVETSCRLAIELLLLLLDRHRIGLARNRKVYIDFCHSLSLAPKSNAVGTVEHRDALVNFPQ